jgi:Xaa-Pro dipeptidase
MRGSVDLDALRVHRLARLQRAMRERDVAACVLLHDPNVRYATGASAMPVWVMSTFARCAVVAQEGSPILFEHGNSAPRSRTRAPDVRPMRMWEFYDDPAVPASSWADETLAALRELGVDPLLEAIAVDRIGTPALLELERRGVTLRDSAPVTQEARRVKTPEEIALFERNAPLVGSMLETLEAHVAPGVSERELLAEMARVLIRGGGEYLATNTVCSGPNTNPWRAEATDRRLREGDLVYVDTDAVAEEGCFFCVSRTFPVGAPTAAQRSTYAAAHDWVTGTKQAIVPGLTCAEVADAAPALPDRFVPQRYECLVHGIGLEEENPSVCHPADGQPNADTVIEPGTVLVVECYMGEVGADHGVKLGDQVVVTEHGVRTLVPHPWSSALLGEPGSPASSGA